MNHDEFEFIYECIKQKRIYGKSYFDLIADIEKLDERISQYKEALEFYAAEKNWEFERIEIDPCEAKHGSQVMWDEGKRAREVLGME